MKLQLTPSLLQYSQVSIFGLFRRNFSLFYRVRFIIQKKIVKLSFGLFYNYLWVHSYYIYLFKFGDLKYKRR